MSPEVLLNLRFYRQVTRRDSFHLCQRGISEARRPIPTSASSWRGQDMFYSRPNYALFHKIEGYRVVLSLGGTRRASRVLISALTVARNSLASLCSSPLGTESFFMM